MNIESINDFQKIQCSKIFRIVLSKSLNLNPTLSLDGRIFDRSNYDGNEIEILQWNNIYRSHSTLMQFLKKNSDRFIACEE